MPIISIQILRAVAALSVAIGHSQNFFAPHAERAGIAFERSNLLPWGAGVDLFFVISGFIMVVSSERLFGTTGATWTFLGRRLKRIIPLYWAVMVLILVKMAVQGKPLPDGASLLTSFLFIPFDALGKGEARPFYELGWTLNYEMFFYAIFALCLGLRRELAVALAALALAGLVLIGLAAPIQSLQLATWTQPIVLEFTLGMGIALLYRRSVALGAELRWTLLAFGLAMLLIDALGTRSQPADWMTPNDLLRVGGWGLAAAAIVAAMALAPPRPAPAGRLALFGSALGDASYALYLLHPLVMGALSTLWFRVPVLAPLPWLGALASVAFSALVALAVHRWLEKPLMEMRTPGTVPATAARA